MVLAIMAAISCRVIWDIPFTMPMPANRSISFCAHWPCMSGTVYKIIVSVKKI
jgi:hypothetical protein